MRTRVTAHATPWVDHGVMATERARLVELPVDGAVLEEVAELAADWVADHLP